MLGASATTRMPREPPTRPMTIQGRRMPSRDEVRSLILPKNGLANIASRAPTPATSARLFGACSIPTSELTFNAKVTSRGARNSRLVPMYASAYSEMKPHPTRVRCRDSAHGAVGRALRRDGAGRQEGHLCSHVFGLRAASLPAAAASWGSTRRPEITT